MKRLFTKVTGVALALMMPLTLVGCSGTRNTATQVNVVEDNMPEGQITNQTATTGISADDPNFVEKLVSGTYYVVTPDNVYYPLYKDYVLNDENAPEDSTTPDRQLYATYDTENEIPTLYSDCNIIYYSKTGILDYIQWERFYDLGYTIGLYNIEKMQSGRYYIDLAEDDNNKYILENTELTQLYDLGKTSILLDRIGGITVDKSVISQRLIKATNKGETYDLEVYNGTQFATYQVTANVHAFRDYELYRSVEYETLQDYFFRVDVPKYFKSGYYMINVDKEDYGIFRYVAGDSWNTTDTDFNEQLLMPEEEDVPPGADVSNYPTLEDKSDPENEDYQNLSAYSEYEPLNLFSTNVEGALGYVDPEAEQVNGKEEKVDTAHLTESKTSTFEIWFPENKTCTIQIISETKETTGKCTIQIGDETHSLSVDRLNGTYTTGIAGTGTKGTLTITGLWDSYDIHLVNCEQYNGQDAGTNSVPAEETEATEEGAESAEETTEETTEEEPAN